MPFSVNRFTHSIKIYKRSSPGDGWSNSLPNVLIKECWANVMVRSGVEMEKFGATIGTQVITIQTYYDPNITNGMAVEWDGRIYEIKGPPQPSHDRHTQILTAFREV